MEHLVEEHSTEKLKAWGLNKKLLKKFIAQENDKLEFKRQKKRDSKKASKEKIQELNSDPAYQLVKARKELVECHKFQSQLDECQKNVDKKKRHAEAAIERLSRLKNEEAKP